ncbi:MAG: biotin/lipoyl-binding protein, partial [Lachnospiraceae bacterium]|nr:biotin/lipoyl-binding protein [Lachnospiraceae bacterium]
MRRRYLVAASGLLICSLLAEGCAGRKPEMEGEPESEALSVNVQMAKKEELVIAETYVGTVSAAEEVTVYPTASGEVLAVDVHVGDMVSSGQQLFKIDDESAMLSLRSAQAGLASAQASADQALGGNEILKEAQEQQNIDTLARAAETSSRNLADAQENVDRGKRSLEDAKEDQTDAKDDWDDAKDKYNTAKSYQDDWEDLRDSEEAFAGKSLSEAVAMTASTTTETTDPTTGVTTVTTTSGPSEENLEEAKDLLADIQDDELTASDITASGVAALKTARDNAKT